MSKLTAVIVEDEIPALMRMRSLVNSFPKKLILLSEANSGKAAIQVIEHKKPDVVFLDIQLPDMSGFDVLAKLSYQPWIVFTTAYSEHALKAFENRTADYLVKPFSRERFEETLSKIVALAGQQSQVDLLALANAIQDIKPKQQRFSLPVKKRDAIILLDFDNISYLKAEDKYVQVVLANGQQHLMNKPISQLEKELPEQFIRVHRSYIVNRTFVQKIKKHFKGNLVLILSDSAETKITTGGVYTGAVKEAFI